MRYLLDRSARRWDGGRVLVAGNPRRVLRLTAAGAALLDAVQRGEDLADRDAPVRLSAGESPQIRPPTAAARLLARLVEAGAVHPLPSTSRCWTPADVTVVVPSLGRDVTELVASLGPVGQVIVVDDGSNPPLGPVPGATVIRHAVNAGPGAARNTGWRATTTPLVAFLDADTRPGPGWVTGLLPHLYDAGTALAAPRIVGPWPASTDGLLARYEAARSPLDLGPSPGPVRPGTPVSFVPGAALLVRVEALRQVGGFDETLRVGEDVDLVWRLEAAGWAARYAPEVVVRHLPRSTWPAWLAQRAAYGRSAAALAGRFPQHLAPVRTTPWSAATWALAALGHPVAGLATVAAAVGLLARRLPHVEHPLALAADLVGRGTLAAGHQLAVATTRVWWPLALAAALVSRRLRLTVAAAALVPAALAWRRDRPPLGLLPYLAVRLLDDAAYGFGVWRGAIAARTPAPLLPALAGRARPPTASPAGPTP